GGVRRCECGTWSIVDPLKNRWICGKTRRRRHDTMDNVRRILSVGLVTLSALVLAGPPASSQEGTLKKIKETGTITLGHRDASIPVSYFDDKQLAGGYAMYPFANVVDLGHDQQSADHRAERSAEPRDHDSAREGPRRSVSHGGVRPRRGLLHG